MSGGFPMLGQLANGLSINNFTSLSRPNQLTAPGATNTKSAYSQLVASSTNDTVAILVRGICGSQNGATASIDIAVGGAGSEKIVVADLFVSTLGNAATADFNGFDILIPVQIPAGSRIAARYQASSTALSVYLGLDLFDGGFEQNFAGIADAIGFTAGTTASTSMTPGAANSKGAYAQLAASTAADYAGFLLSVDASTWTGINNAQIDVAIGGAGSESIILPDYYVRFGDGGGQLSPCISPFLPIPIPAGSRIAARCAADGVTAMGIVLTGVRQ